MDRRFLYFPDSDGIYCVFHCKTHIRNILFLSSSDRISAVSYTHLYVYMRMAYADGVYVFFFAVFAVEIPVEICFGSIDGVKKFF